LSPTASRATALPTRTAQRADIISKAARQAEPRALWCRSRHLQPTPLTSALGQDGGGDDVVAAAAFRL
jgi:hypothetical protein